MKSRWEGILASIFLGFLWILEAKLGSKMEPRSIQNGVEKTIEKRRAPGCTKSRNMTPQGPAAPRIQGPGEGVGGEVNHSPKGKGKGSWKDAVL